LFLVSGPRASQTDEGDSGPFVAFRCATVHRVRKTSFGPGRQAPALCGSRPSRSLRGYGWASTWITLSFMDQPQCPRLMPRPKFGRPRPTTPAAAPATFRLIHLQVIRREKMTVAADMCTAMGSRIRSRKKHTTSVLVAPKQAPATNFNGLHRFGPGCRVAPPLLAVHAPMVDCLGPSAVDAPSSLHTTQTHD
jgi:hypothetical protein